MLTPTRALRFTLSRPTPSILTGQFIPNKENNQPSENILRHYWGQWTEPRDIWSQGWMRPYQGDQQGFTQWRGGISWGHYIPSHDPREEPTAYRRTWRDRITPQMRIDKRPHLLSMKAFTNVNQHNLWRDKRDSAWKGWYYHFNIPVEPKNFRPNLWLQSNYIMTQDNWKPITDSEAKAHQERSEIAGRNRRYFWKLKFHPLNGKYFTDKGTDAQWVRFMRAKHEINALWGEDQHARREWGFSFKVFVVPFFIVLYLIKTEENSEENCRTRSYLGKTPQIVYLHDGHRPTNWIFGGATEDKFTSWHDLVFGDGIKGITSALTLFMFDDFRKTQMYQYKQYTKYAEAAGIAGADNNESFYATNMLHDPMREAYHVTHGKDTLPKQSYQ